MAARYSDTITTQYGTVLPGAVLELLDGVGSPVTLYSDAGLTTPATPVSTRVTADNNGYVVCYVPDGTYSVRQSYGDVSKTIPNVELYDQSDVKDALALIGTGKANASALGVAGTAADMGAFSGSIIPDSQTAKQAIQSLETAAERRMQTVVHANDAPFNCKFDGVTDDRAGLQAAIDFVNARGGGDVVLPIGTAIVTNNGSSIGLSLKSGVNLVGQGVGTAIKLADGANAHVVNVVSVFNCGIRDLTIDGNRVNQTVAVHAIRVGGVDGLTVDNVVAQGAYHYGIGIQAGTNKRVKIHNVYVHDTGGDGIDIKNKNNDNEDIQLSNITVKSWGYNAIETGQTAIDCRGPVSLTNIWVSDPIENDACGVRFRQGEIGDANGLGAHRSTLTNFQIRMGSGTAQIGLNAVARDVAIGQGYIGGGFRGVLVQDSGFSAVGVTVESASNAGWLLDAAGGGLNADKAVLTACKGINCGSDGFVTETQADFIGCTANGNGQHGLRIQATATNTQLLGGDYTGNVSPSVLDGGTGTVAIRARGYLTENYVESADLTLDSTGSKVAVLAHGMSKAPDKKKCSITHVMGTAVSDYAMAFYQVEAVDANNITVRARVSAASASSGATFKLGVTVRV